MKYPPKQHQVENRDHMVEVIRRYPLATVISVENNTPFITHLPLIYEEEKLIGHIDIYNPQARLLSKEHPVTVIFQGPQCYISPSIYSSTQLHTWNYIKVHLQGKVKAINSKKELRDSLISMTEFLEGEQPQYTLDKNNPRMEKYLDYIQMFEITISNWEGKFKLSQDKKPSDQEAAKKEMARATSLDITNFLKQVSD